MAEDSEIKWQISCLKLTLKFFKMTILLKKKSLATQYQIKLIAITM